MDLIKSGLITPVEIKNNNKKNQEKYIYDITKSYVIQSTLNNKAGFKKAITGLKETPNYKKILSIFENDSYILIYKHIQEEYVFLYINYNGQDVYIKYNRKKNSYNASNIPNDLQKSLIPLSYLNSYLNLETSSMLT